MAGTTFILIVELLTMVAKLAPKLADGVRDLLDILKGVNVVDITKEEAIKRIEDAQAALPEWKEI